MPESATRGSLPPWLVNLALVAASVLFGLIVIELVLRVLGWSYPLFGQPDADLGWSFRPGLSGWSAHEDTAHVRINRYGFRGGDWTEQPAPDVLRIAVLGDSYTDSTNLPEEQSLTGQIQSHLSSCPALAGRRPEVLNFGVSAYGTGQHYLQLQHRVAAFHPQMVLLAFYAGNDVPDNSRPLSVLTEKPYFTVLPSGELQYDGTFRDSAAFRAEVGSDWQRRLVNASYLLQAAKQVYLGKGIVPSPLKSQVFKATGAEPVPEPQNPPLFGPPPDDTWRAAWDVTEKLLVLMRDWSQAHGMAFRLTIIPDPIEALPGENLRRAALVKNHLADLDYPVTRIADVAARKGIATLSLLEALRAFGDRERQFVYGFYADKPGYGHLNAFGNEVAGRAIAAWLCATAVNK